MPEGTKLYSSIFGEVVFIRIDRENPSYPILIKVSFEPKWRNLTKQGKFYAAVGECILFPSKDQRDWSKFVRFWENPKEESKVERFNPKTLQPFDKVLVRKMHSKYNIEPWSCEYFSYINPNTKHLVNGISSRYEICIPYNEETKHLAGKRDDCPEYYKWWEI